MATAQLILRRINEKFALQISNLAWPQRILLVISSSATHFLIPVLFQGVLTFPALYAIQGPHI